MKEKALEILQAVSEPGRKMNLLREYLQASVLRSFHESGAFSSLSFVGGTALRFLHSLPRFSEDLYFSLENLDRYEPKAWLAKLKRDLAYAGFEPELTWDDARTVNACWIKLPRILQEAGIVNRRDQKISIKIEIDTRPPEGAILETRLVNRHMLFALRHHSLPCLMAGKVHALLSRTYQKGRDWYDLCWYLGRIPPVEPELTFLEAALLQQRPPGEAVPAASWRSRVRKTLEGLDESLIQRDVAPFLEQAEDIQFLKRPYLESILGEG